jgi:xanthine dehydrogenase accessory factor
METESGTPVSPFIVVKAAGEMASAVAWRLYMSNMRRICMIDLDNPLCVRRQVSFCPALESGSASVEGVKAVAARDWDEVDAAWDAGNIAVVRTTDWVRMAPRAPDILIDAILAKRNVGTRIDDAVLVVALGPGFDAGRDCHFVIETNRGHDLGRIINSGSAAPNTGIPGNIAGQTDARVLRAPAGGAFRSERSIGDRVKNADIVGYVDGKPVAARLEGMLRGLIRTGTDVTEGVKLGDIDPRGASEYCNTISDKARAIAGSVLECVMRHCNRAAQTRQPGRC